MRKLLVLSAALLLCGAARGEKAAPKAQAKELSKAARLKEICGEIKKSPDDWSLREKAVGLAAGMKPAPAVPPEARKPFVKATTFQKEATSVSDYQLAIAAYKEALLIAPWWADAIYNLASAQESAGLYDESARSFSLYLLSKPKDAEETQERLYALEAKKEKAAKDAEEAERKTREKFAEALPGEWVRPHESPICNPKDFYRLTRQGSGFALTFERCVSDCPDGGGCYLSGYAEKISFFVNAARRASGPWWGDFEVTQNYGPWGCGMKKQQGNVDGTVSEDLNSITLKIRMDVIETDGCRLSDEKAERKYELRRAD